MSDSSSSHCQLLQHSTSLQVMGLLFIDQLYLVVSFAVFSKTVISRSSYKLTTIIRGLEKGCSLGLFLVRKAFP